VFSAPRFSLDSRWSHAYRCGRRWQRLAASIHERTVTMIPSNRRGWDWCAPSIGKAGVVALAIAAASAPLRAQDGKEWVGKRVLLPFASVLRVGNQVVDNQKREARGQGRERATRRIYRVKRGEGPWLWLKAEGEGASGWVKAAEVIPYDEAINHFTNKIRANPSDPSAYNSRGQLWNEKKEYDIALADYNESIRLDPSNEVNWASRSNVWHDKKEYDKAIADNSEAIRLDPSYAMAYYNRGNAWRSEKQYVKAIADYTEAIRLDPKYVAAYRGRGMAWRDMKEYDKAIADYAEAIRVDPSYVAAYVCRGNVLDDMRQRGKAIADYSEAIRIDPEYAYAYYNRGIALDDNQEYDKAIADYSEAIRIDPKFALSYIGLAWLRATCPDQKFRDGQRAVELATKACELTEWKDANPVFTLAAAHAEAGDFAKAVEFQTKANAMYDDPEDKKKGEERLKLYQQKTPYRDVKP
jgi:tetratricopeptide (TPR) repeat protein